MIRQEEEITDEKADQLIAGLELSLQAQNATKKEVTKTGAISDLFDKSILSYLENAFANSTSGYYSLRADEFRKLIAEYIPSSLVETVYRAIDVNDLGKVNYADFTNYLIASEAGNSFSARTVIAKLSFLHVQEEDSSLGLHRDAIDCLLYVRKPIPMLVSGGRDGQVALWDPDTLLPVAFIDHRDKNAVYQEEFSRGMDTLMKAKIAKNVSTHHKRVPTKMAVTALKALFNWGLLCVGSADCAVTIYELATQDIIGRYSSMEDIPTSIECFQLTHTSSSNTPASANTNNFESGQSQQNQQLQEVTVTYLMIGDSRGFLHQLVFDGDFGSVSEVGSKKRNQISFIRAVNEGRFLLREVASDWITEMKYIPEVNAMLVASRDGSICFVDCDKRIVLKVFRGHVISSSLFISNNNSSSNPSNGQRHSVSDRSAQNRKESNYSENHSNMTNNQNSDAKNKHIINNNSNNINNNHIMHHIGYGDPAIGGVQCFDWSAFGKYIVSASERQLIFWDPFTCETMTRIDNLRSPVVSLQAQDEVNKIFCALASKVVLVLHNITFETLQTIADFTTYRPVNALSSMCFSPDRQTLFTAGHKIACWSLEKSAEDAEHRNGTGNSSSSTGDVGSGQDEDLVAALYNNLFNTVLLVKSLGTLKIYQAESGELTRQFSVCPVDPVTGTTQLPKRDPVTGVCLAMILQATLDRNQTRLLVLAADLSVQFWSVTDGSLLTQVAPQLFSTSLAHIYGSCKKQVTQILHDTITIRQSGDRNSSNNKNNKTSVDLEQTKVSKLLLVGTTLGHICGYPEMHAHIDEIPTSFLRLTEETSVSYTGVVTHCEGIAMPSLIPHPPAISVNSVAINNVNKTDTSEIGSNKRRPSHNHSSSSLGARIQRHIIKNNQNTQNNKNIHTHLDSMHSTESVLWMKTLPGTSLLLTAYLSGKMVLWDVENNRKVRDISIHQMGAILNGMKQKNKKLKAVKTFSNNNETVVLQAINKHVASHHGHGMHENKSNASDNHNNNSNNKNNNNSKDNNTNNKDHSPLNSNSLTSYNSSSNLSYMSAEIDAVTESLSVSNITTQDKDINTKTNQGNAANNIDSKNNKASTRSKRREELEKDRLAAKVAVAAQAVAASVAAQFANTLDDILNDSDDISHTNIINSNDNNNSDAIVSADDIDVSLSNTRKNKKRSNSNNADNNSNLFINGLDFSGVNSYHTERMTVTQRRAVAMQQMSQQLRRKDSALSAFTSGYNCGLRPSHIHVKHRTQHISLLRQTNNKSGSNDNNAETGLVRGGTEEVFDSNHPEQSLSDDDSDNNDNNNTNNNIVIHTVPAPPSLSIRPSRTVTHMKRSEVHLTDTSTDTFLNDNNSSNSLDDVDSSTIINHNDEVRKSRVHGGRRLIVRMGDGCVVNSVPRSEAFHLQHLSANIVVAAQQHHNNHSQHNCNINNITNTNNANNKNNNVSTLDINANEKSSNGTKTETIANDLENQVNCNSISGNSVIVNNITSVSVNDTMGDSHSVHSARSASVRHNKDSVVNNVAISVDCLALLPKSQVFIGACSDRYLRFWDAETFHVLCSCLYVDLDPSELSMHLNSHNNANNANTNNANNNTINRPVKVNLPLEACGGDMLRLLKVSDSEDVLIGGYESGVIRVWAIQAYSIVTLRNLLQKHLQFSTLPSYLQQNNNTNNNSNEFGEGMTLAIAPLSLLCDWTAHNCPILSLEYVWFNYEDKDNPGNINNTDRNNNREKNNNNRHKRDKQSDMGVEVLDGYLVSAGLDQKVFLWSLMGKCVGEFGGFSWDINVENSWMSSRQNALNNLFLSHRHSSSSHSNKNKYHSGKNTSSVVSKKGSSGKGNGGGGFRFEGSSGDADYQRDKQRLHQQILHQYRHNRVDVDSDNRYQYANSSHRLYNLQQQFHPRHITADSVALTTSPSTQFLHNFCIESISGEKEHTSGEIGEYLEILTKRLQHKVANYSSLDQQFKEVTQKHPLIDPALPKKEDFRKMQKKLGIVGV